MDNIFALTSSQMLMLMLFLAVGYAFSKCGLLPKDADTVLARLETYLIMPAMIINTLAEHCTPEALRGDGALLITATICTAAAVLLSYPLSALFAKPGQERNVYRYSFAFSNTGYVGAVVILNVFGQEMLFHYLMFSIPYFFATYTWGIFTLTSEYRQKKFSWKQLLQPIMLALAVGTVIGLLRIELPPFLGNAVSSAASCLGPIAMLLTGMVIAKFRWRELLADWRVYAASAIRLVALPAIFTLAARALGVTGTTLACVLATVCMPFGLNSVVFPTAYNGDARPGASMVIVSHALSAITVPIFFMLFFRT